MEGSAIVGAAAIGLIVAGVAYVASGRKEGGSQTYLVKTTKGKPGKPWGSILSGIAGLIGPVRTPTFMGGTSTGGGSSPAPTSTGGGVYMGSGNYDSFKQAMGVSESGSNYGIGANSEGYNGMYQFGQARLNDYTRSTGDNITMSQFNASPALQEKVMDWHLSDIESYIVGNGYDQYYGQTVAGVRMDRDAMFAMAHLGGSGGMGRFLSSNGGYNPADSNGTSLADYARKFSGYH